MSEIKTMSGSAMNVHASSWGEPRVQLATSYAIIELDRENATRLRDGSGS